MTLNITLLLIIASAISGILVILSSIKLIRGNNIPGSRLIFISVVGSLLSTFIPEAESKSRTPDMLIELLKIALNSLLMLMAAYGFYLLASYAYRMSNTRN